MGEGERACVPDAPIEPKFAMNVRVNEVRGAGRSQREGSPRTRCRRAESRELDRDAISAEQTEKGEKSGEPPRRTIASLTLTPTGFHFHLREHRKKPGKRKKTITIIKPTQLANMLPEAFFVLGISNPINKPSENIFI